MNELVIPLNIKDYINHRDEIVKNFRNFLESKRNLSASISSYGVGNIYAPHVNGFQDERDLKKKIAEVDFEFWKHIFSKSKLTSAMSTKKRDEFLKNVEKENIEFNIENINSLIQNFDTLFRENCWDLVIQVYKQLIKCEYASGDWRHRKYDNLQKIESVFRISGTDIRPRDPSWYKGEFSYDPNQIRGFHFNDLISACFLIEGLGLPDYSNNFYSYAQPQLKNKGKVIKTPWFTVHAYQNGNCKVSWESSKQYVLDKLNLIGSGDENALPDIMRKRYKKDHFQKNSDTIFNLLDIEEEPTENGNDFGFFPTPSEVVDRMIELAEIGEYDSILEPSAGEGAILSELGRRRKTTAVEYSQKRYEYLQNRFRDLFQLVNDDFLKWNKDYTEKFDVVLMNPPFSSSRIEIKHFLHAFRMVRPGGKIVCILPEGHFFKSDSKAKLFLDFLEQNGYISEKLERGTFSESGTEIATRIVKVQR